MRVDTAKTVRELALEVPHATRVFEKLGIDYCCGGGKSLEEACSVAQVSVDEVLQSLDTTAPADSGVDWKTASLRELIEHILSRHHAYVKAEIPRLQALLAKVNSVHGERHPELAAIQDEFRAVSGELLMHCMKEEQILFPYIGEMETARLQRRAVEPPMFGTVRSPIQMMIMEHDSAGEALRTIRQASNGFTAPADGCVSYQTLYRALAEFEADLHQHTHLENNILFPRAVEMEGSF